VQALTTACYQVYAINPLAVARYRDATTSPARNPTPVTPGCSRTWYAPTGKITGRSPETARTWRRSRSSPARGHQNLIWSRTRQTNALRSALREYYPAALEVFDDLHDRDTLAVLGRAPTPAEAAHLTLPAIQSDLKKAGRQRNIDGRAREIQAGLRAEHLPRRRRSLPRSPSPPEQRSVSSSS
jgi:hypothetical protein